MPISYFFLACYKPALPTAYFSFGNRCGNGIIKIVFGNSDFAVNSNLKVIYFCFRLF